MIPLDDCEELELRISKFKTYERLGDFFGSYPYAFVVVVMLPFIIEVWLGWNPNNSYIGWIPIVVLTLLWFVALYRVKKICKEFKVEDIEWATYYSNKIVDALEKAKSAKTQGSKKSYYKKALGYAKDFSVCIDKRWTIGKFQLVRTQFEPVIKFKAALRKVIIPFLSKATEQNQDTIDRLGQIMTNLFYESAHLNVEGIAKINESVYSTLKVEAKPSIEINDITSFFSNHKIVKNMSFVLSVIVGCVFFYQGATIYVGIVKEYAFTGSIAIFALLMTIYFTKRKS